MKVIVTGAAGFIGSHAARRYLSRGWEVVAIDNLSRDGSERNLEWLQDHGNIEFIQADVTSVDSIMSVFREHSAADVVLHFAAQVAVTDSLSDPRRDFEVNALGTLNVLEASRLFGIKGPLLFSSTNKVYGQLDDLRVIEGSSRYSYERRYPGVAEDRSMDFHSPYGCSKGSADQYVKDYHRIYGLRTVVFRQSCIYGTRQFGIEDQGWIAWFAIAHELGLPVTIYGDGKQTRDILYIEDLLNAFDAAISRIDRVAGSVFNIGGGTDNTISLRELVKVLDETSGSSLSCKFAPWRPGDQRVYVSDIRKAGRELKWKPLTNCQEGIRNVCAWVHANKDLCAEVLSDYLARRKAAATVQAPVAPVEPDRQRASW